jgi:alpha-beta hydrolase superfamily lysophospholipase
VPKLQRQLSWLKALLAGVAAASGVGYLATAYTVSRWLTRSSRCRPHPTPDALGLDWNPLECRTGDGLLLKGWVVAPPAPRATVALFHGLRRSRAQALDRMELLVRAGYRCVAFDHRAHGESGGRRTSFGFREARDVTAVLDLVARRWPHQGRAALGISMGAAALCFAAAQARGLDAVVLESLYHDLDSTFQNRIGSKFPAWFGRFRRGVVWVTERRLGLRLRQVAPADHIGELAPAPVLLLTGAEDPHAPPHDAERLFARCRGPRELALIPGADHGNLVVAGGRLYRDLLLGFLERHLAGRARAAA